MAFVVDVAVICVWAGRCCRFSSKYTSKYSNWSSWRKQPKYCTLAVMSLNDCSMLMLPVFQWTAIMLSISLRWLFFFSSFSRNIFLLLYLTVVVVFFSIACWFCQLINFSCFPYSRSRLNNSADGFRVRNEKPTLATLREIEIETESYWCRKEKAKWMENGRHRTSIKHQRTQINRWTDR